VAIIHFILQGKGGVGKSMIASILNQVLQHLDKTVVCFDTDPENATLSSYKEFSVRRLDILKGDNIDKRMFDTLFEEIFALGEQDHAIVDSGASSFIALSGYIKENDALQLLTDYGHTVYLHTVITGGQAIMETLNGFNNLATNFTNTRIVVWLNPYFGEIRVDNKPFEEFKVYRDHYHQVSALIMLPDAEPNTLGRDLEELFAKRQSFEAGYNSSAHMMVRGRLKRYYEKLVGMIRQAEFVGN
jgi:energy-coupling factor transporter ATP-binding protein EcfA2